MANTISMRRIREDILLHDIVNQRYDIILQLLHEGVEPVARIRSDSYVDSRYENLEMLPIHLAVKDGAPIYIIQALVEAWPMSLAEKDTNGLRPIHLLSQYYYIASEYVEVNEYLKNIMTINSIPIN